MMSSDQFREFVDSDGGTTDVGDEFNDFGARGAPTPLWISPSAGEMAVKQTDTVNLGFLMDRRGLAW
ncbi:hypothetical protein SAMN05444166_1711 [Singulisphaera sp. GP187]|uniref:hypothetical protein n=1 Tax=Singulisphaera sp. GP187 TaxID=1882752 RepID=UPI000927ACD2|nr:hypothetical protein [Singulisphaera sp. GP187]SIN94123.1 hypothetical protein SAMN05444166_1711 [Singulisphaera sp. GP187]